MGNVGGFLMLHPPSKGAHALQSHVGTSQPLVLQEILDFAKLPVVALCQEQIPAEAPRAASKLSLAARAGLRI